MADFSLAIGDGEFTGWTEISIRRSIERMSGEFGVRLTTRPVDGQGPQIAPGEPVEVKIDGQVVLDGYIDAVSVSYAKNAAEITVAGRDRVADLIDCAAAVDGPFEFTRVKLDAAIRKVVAPFKIDVIVEADMGETFARLAIQPGETAFEFIERACRFRGVLPVSNGIGGIVITKPSTVKSPGKLAYGNNILACETSFDMRERMSLYVVKGQAEALDGYTETSAMVGPEGRAVDSAVKRYRPKLVVGENQSYELSLNERAAWEKKIAAARAARATYTVADWYADGKTLWQPNTLVWVADSLGGLNQEMLIVGVEMIRNRTDGAITRLELALPGAFDLLAEKQDAAESSSSGGSTSSGSLWAEDA